MKKRARYILDAGAQFDITVAQAAKLVKLNLIHWCLDCKCYHINSDKEWRHINRALGRKP